MENNRPNRLSIDTDAKTGESHATIAGTIPQILFNLTVLTASVCDETGITPEMWGTMLPGVIKAYKGGVLKGAICYDLSRIQNRGYDRALCSDRRRPRYPCHRLLCVRRRGSGLPRPGKVQR